MRSVGSSRVAEADGSRDPLGLPSFSANRIRAALAKLEVVLARAVERMPDDVDALSVMRVRRSDVLQRLGAEKHLPAVEEEPLELDWLPEELLRRWELSRFDASAALVALAPELDSKYERVYALLQENVDATRPRVGLLVDLISPGGDRLRAAAQFLPGAPLLAQGILSVSGGGDLALSSRVVHASDLLVRLAVGGPLVGPQTRMIAPPPAARHEERRSPSYEASGVPAMWLFPASGRSSEGVQRSLAEQYGRPVLQVHAGPLLGGSGAATSEELTSLAKAAGALLGIEDAHLCLTSQLAESALADVLSAAAAQRVGVVLVGTEPPPSQLETRAGLSIVALPALTAEEREETWRYHLGESRVEAASELAARLGRLLPMGQYEIAKASADAFAHAGGGRPIDLALLESAALRAYRTPSRLGRHVPLRRGWSDLKLNRPTKSHLAELRDQIGVHVNLRSESGVTQGIVALFSGPSGTGKTLAAEVIARSLGMNLFRISASQIYDKYVGQTETNIDALFELVGAAHGAWAETIVLVDEAEWLFSGRVRGSGGDAHDHYLNLRVGHLLQHVENQTGVVLLTSNLSENIDAAFGRRWFQHVVFDPPDADVRKELWLGSLRRAGVPYDAVDVDSLASSFALTGANIENIVRLSKYDVAAQRLGHKAEGTAALRMNDILAAMSREYGKIGHSFPVAELAKKLSRSRLGGRS